MRRLALASGLALFCLLLEYHCIELAGSLFELGIENGYLLCRGERAS